MTKWLIFDDENGKWEIEDVENEEDFIEKSTKTHKELLAPLDEILNLIEESK